MRVSHIELAASAALLLLFVSPAAAQLGPPMQLFPQSAPAKTSSAPPAQTPSAAGSSPSAPAPGSAASSPGPADQSISATPLAPMDTSWAGTLGAADRAFPRDMWANTKRAFVAAALPLLQPTTSPVLQDLARRLLLSDAIAPAGQDPSGEPSLAELRLGRLLALGQVDGIGILGLLPRADADENFERESVELRFAANDVAGACRTIRNLVGRYQDAWWERALIACQALKGEYNQASLGLNVMHEKKGGRDPVFDTLIEAIDGHGERVPRLPDPTPIRMALLAAAKLPLPADALATAGPAALTVWATSTKVPALQRLAAAEKAEALGALPPAALGLLYSSIDVTPGERQAALKSGKVPEHARDRAVLYQIAQTSNTPKTKAAALAPLLADAQRRGVFAAMARVVAPLVAELEPSQDLQSFAADAARVLLVTGHAAEAKPWIDLAHQPALRLVADLARPAKPAGGGSSANAPSAPDSSSPNEAIKALASSHSGVSPGQADLLVALFSALGDKLDSFDFTRLLQPAHEGTFPDAALWLDQRQAAASGRLGETVLTSLLLASAGDRLTSEPVVLARVVAGLEAVGLDTDARSLAVEAAIAAGI